MRVRKLTEGKYTGERESEEEQRKGDPELASFAHSREEWTASSSLPDLMQRRIHRLNWKEECIVFWESV
jgi:hypothetical protein